MRFNEDKVYVITGYDLNRLWTVSSRFMAMEKLDAEQRRAIGKVMQHALSMAEDHDKAIGDKT